MFKVLVLLIVIAVSKVRGERCLNYDQIEEGAQIRPIVVWKETNTCYFAFEKGPCADGEWLEIEDPTQKLRMERPGICKTRTCPETPEEEEEASDYPKFWFTHNGECVQADTVNEGICGSTSVKAYYTEDEVVPVCLEDPDVLVGRGFWGSYFRKLKGY